MKNRLLQRINIDSLKKGDQFKISSSKTLYTYSEKVNGRHVACRWVDDENGIMTVLPGKSMQVERVSGSGMPKNCSFGSSFQKLLLSRKVVVS